MGGTELKILPVADFCAGFPDDEGEWREDECIRPGGRNIADAIIELLRADGLTPYDIEADLEHYGWEFRVLVDRSRLWFLLVVLSPDECHLHIEDQTDLFGWLPPVRARYAQALLRVSRLLAAEPRFSAMLWFDKYHQRQEGSHTPVLR